MRRELTLHQISPFPDVIGRPFFCWLKTGSRPLDVRRLGDEQAGWVGLLVEGPPGLGSDMVQEKKWFAAVPTGHPFEVSDWHVYLGAVDYKGQTVVVYQVDPPPEPG